MSRTIRKRCESFEYYYRNFLRPGGYWESNSDDFVAKQKAKYYGRSDKFYEYGLPRWYRNAVNKKRRRHDNHEIWKALNNNDYAEQCSAWNCKDSCGWGYW